MRTRENGGHTSRERTLAVAVTEEIAAARGTEATSLDVQLFDYVEPEALNRLQDHAAERGTGSWELRFDVEDLTVTVRSDGTITVT